MGMKGGMGWHSCGSYGDSEKGIWTWHSLADTGLGRWELWVEGGDGEFTLRGLCGQRCEGEAEEERTVQLRRLAQETQKVCFTHWQEISSEDEHADRLWRAAGGCLGERLLWALSHVLLPSGSGVSAFTGTGNSGGGGSPQTLASSSLRGAALCISASAAPHLSSAVSFYYPICVEQGLCVLEYM